MRILQWCICPLTLGSLESLLRSRAPRCSFCVLPNEVMMSCRSLKNGRTLSQDPTILSSERDYARLIRLSIDTSHEGTSRVSLAASTFSSCTDNLASVNGFVGLIALICGYFPQICFPQRGWGHFEDPHIHESPTGYHEVPSVSFLWVSLGQADGYEGSVKLEGFI